MNASRSQVFVHVFAVLIALVGAGSCMGGTLYLMSMPSASANQQIAAVCTPAPVRKLG
jgi:hypothetical protein